MSPNLADLGWDAFFEEGFGPYRAKHLEPARVAVQHNQVYRLMGEGGEITAVGAGRLRHRAAGRHELPAVGDWVAVRRRRHEEGLIQAVLPRKTRFSRKLAGETSEEQVIAANIDILFLVSGLDRDLNPRRIERYLILAWDSGARPVIVLNKADLCSDPEAVAERIRPIAADVPVEVVSSLRGDGLAELQDYLERGKTGALLGSSGVGKSTIINRLIGEIVMETRPVRASDDRGRHATTRRELFVLAGGGILIDTPGMRELQLWEGQEGFTESFRDIEEIADECRFRDCRHEGEPDCAVRRAIDEGRLSEPRLTNYLKLQKELDHQALQQDRLSQQVEKKKLKAIMRAATRHRPRE